MLKRMYFNVLMNREIGEGEHASPGGFTVELGDGKNFTFDFLESSCGPDTDDPAVLHAEMECPDFDYAREMSDMRGEDVTWQDFECMSAWKDFYIDLEACGEGLHPVRVLGLAVEFEENGKSTTWNAPREILQQIDGLFAEREMERGE